MLKIAKDQYGNKYNVDHFKSSAEAHIEGRLYYDDCDIRVTPCIYDGHESYFRYVTDYLINSSPSGISPEHLITQERFKYIFEKKDTFWVRYWHRTATSLIYKEVDLKKYYDIAIMEGREDNRAGDVLLKSSFLDIPPILIEVWYKHQCEQSKIDEGHLMIEFKIISLEDIANKVQNWGLKEDRLDRKRPIVRFHNFRERANELPWNNE